MTVRRTYQFNTVTAGRGDGVFFNDPCDLHFRKAGLYSQAPYGMDADSTTFLSVGDRPGYKPNSASFPVDIIGGLKNRFRIVNSTTVPDVDDFGILCDTTGGGVIINLPAISTVVRNVYFIENIGPLTGTNLVTINRNGTDLVDGATALYLSTGSSVHVFADSTSGEWRVIARRPRLQEIYKNLAGPVASTSSGSYVTLATSASIFFLGRPSLFTLVCSARNIQTFNEWWKMDYAIRFDAGSDIGIGGLTNNNNETHEHATLSAIIKPPVGSHTVDIRWKRWAGTANTVMDINDQLVLTCLET